MLEQLTKQCNNALDFDACLVHPSGSHIKVSASVHWTLSNGFVIFLCRKKVNRKLLTKINDIFFTIRRSSPTSGFFSATYFDLVTEAKDAQTLPYTIKEHMKSHLPVRFTTSLLSIQSSVYCWIESKGDCSVLASFGHGFSRFCHKL